MKTIARTTKLTVVLLGTFALLASAQAQNDLPGFNNPRARVTRPAAGQALTAPSQATPASVVAGYLRGQGASQATVDSLRPMAENRAARTGITHLRIEQQLNGLTVHGAYVKAAINNRGELIHLIDNVVPVPAAPASPATITEVQALSAAMAQVHPDVRVTFRQGARNGNTTTFGGGAFFHSDPTVTLVAIPMNDGSMAVGFLVETWSEDQNLLNHTLVSGDGRVLSVELRTANDSYRVFVEDPLKGPQTVVSGPGSGNAESPVGWLGSGSQMTINISGNNVNAYLDANVRSGQANKPDTGGTAVNDGNFLASANLMLPPSTTVNQAVAVQNLFYLNNIIHDELYTHGFNEAEGNFQVDNFGKGGAGGDPVLAEAQDGGGMNNANFATPADGSKPRMQMYLWSGVGPNCLVHVNSSSPVDYAAKGASFGPNLPAKGLTGDVTDIESDGCGAISSLVRGKIVMMNRGNSCDFTVKVFNAQSAGAIAVIVVNDPETWGIVTMGGTDRRIRIPSVMVSGADGATLRDLLSVGVLNITLRKNPNTPQQIDGDLDSDVVFHEYGHGLTWRMIGGMSGPLSGAVGEGASDGLAMLMNGDDRMGEYAYSNPNGIRSAPYTGYTRTYGDVAGTEVHHDGEVFAAIIWRLIELFDENGILRDVLMDYFVDGMNFTASYPAFEDMRDGMLQSVANGSSPEHCHLVWQAFAQFGVGVNASGTVNGSTVTVSEDFTLPDGCSP